MAYKYCVIGIMLKIGAPRGTFVPSTIVCTQPCSMCTFFHTEPSNMAQMSLDIDTQESKITVCEELVSINWFWRHNTDERQFVTRTV